MLELQRTFLGIGKHTEEKHLLQDKPLFHNWVKLPWDHAAKKKKGIPCFLQELVWPPEEMAELTCLTQ